MSLREVKGGQEDHPWLRNTDLQREGQDGAKRLLPALLFWTI